MHHQKSGVAHLTSPDEEALFNQVRWLLSYLPSNNLTPAPAASPADDALRRPDALRELIPNDPQRPYDMHAIIDKLWMTVNF